MRDTPIRKAVTIAADDIAADAGEIGAAIAATGDTKIRRLAVGNWIGLGLAEFRPMLRMTLVLFLLAVLGCSTVDGTVQRPRKWRIAVVPKGTTHEFWKTVHYGAERAADELEKELGHEIEIIWKGPINEGNREDQINLVKDLTVMGVDGICLAPISKIALKWPVRQAKARGIPVVIFDSGLDDPESIVSYVATDNEVGGRIGARTLANALGKKGNVILLRYCIGSESTGLREDGFLDELKQYPDIRVLESTQFSGTTRDSALEVCQRLLLAHRDQVNGVFAVCEPNGVGMHDALKSADLLGKVKFVGFDTSPRLIEAMQEGHMQGIVLQDPDTMGYLAVKTIVRHMRGEMVEPRITTGEYVAKPDNLQTADIHRLIHPPQID